MVRSCSKIAIDVSKKRMKAVIEGMKKLTQSSYADCKAACEGLGVKREMPDVKEAAAPNAWHLERLAGSLTDMTVSDLPAAEMRSSSSRILEYYDESAGNKDEKPLTWKHKGKNCMIMKAGEHMVMLGGPMQSKDSAALQ